MGLEHDHKQTGDDLVPDPRRFCADGSDATRSDPVGTPHDEPHSAEAVSASLGGDAARAAMIRAAADGELSDTECARVLGDERAIAFERTLRDATARAMGGVSTPAHLRSAVLATIRGSGPTADQPTTHTADQAALTDAMESRAAVTRSPGFWSVSRVVGSLAAALVLTVVGVFAWQLGAASTRGSGAGGMGGIAQGEGEQLAYRTSLARFVAGEHTRTLDNGYARRKYIYTAPKDAADAIGSTLEHTPVIPPCGGATKFAGASPCGVPGNGPSAHMQFILPVHDANGAIVPGAEGRKVSVFVKQDRGELAIEAGTTYLVDSAACDVSDSYICVWRRDGLLYTLVSEDRNAPMCTEFLAQFGVQPPDPAHTL